MPSQTICSRCILDNTVPEIIYDEHGECNYCKLYDRLERKYPLNDEGKKKLDNIVKKIKSHGKNKEYDCIVGVSGGRDSTYVLYLVKKLGLNPLAVHMDNGWNSDIAIKNIENSTRILDVDLHTVVLDWEEFKDLQLAFLKASVPDVEITTDIAIMGALYSTAADEGIRYVIAGKSFRTEGNSPVGWTYMDGRYVESVYKKFTGKNIKSITNITLTNLLFFMIFKRIRFVHLLEFFEYNEKEVEDILVNHLSWKPYGHKHGESTFTSFFQTYILPKKFSIDKRKVHYSALIRSGQMRRDEALEKIKKPPIDSERMPIEREYVLKKLGINEFEFEMMMEQQIRSHKDYQTYKKHIKTLKYPIKIACKLGLIPEVLYEKYAR